MSLSLGVTHSGRHPALVEHRVESIGLNIRNVELHLATTEFTLQEAILPSAPISHQMKCIEVIHFTMKWYYLSWDMRPTVLG